MNKPDGFVSGHEKRGICGVMAIAVAASVRYDVAWNTLKQIMLDKGIGQRFRGGTYPSQQLEALSRLAVKYEVLNKCKGWKVWEFAALASETDKLYMITYKGHIFCLKNGMILDQGYDGPVQNWHNRNKRITRIVEITGKGW